MINEPVFVALWVPARPHSVISPSQRFQCYKQPVMILSADQYVSTDSKQLHSGAGQEQGLGKWEAPAEMREFAICMGRQQASSSGGQVYYACRGSVPDTRGYTCGLWMLLHSLSVGCATARHRTAAVD